MMTIDTTNTCSHLRRKLFEWEWSSAESESNKAKKVLVLAGMTAPKVIREDRILEMKNET